MRRADAAVQMDRREKGVYLRLPITGIPSSPKIVPWIGVLAASIVFFGLSFRAAPAAENTSWMVNCEDGESVSRCSISHSLYFHQEVDGELRNMGLALKLTFLYTEDPETGQLLNHLSVRLPLGVDLRQGAVLKVDDHPEVHMSYLQCTNSGCDASLRMTPESKEALKRGRAVRVGFMRWRETQTTVIEATLAGFTKAVAALDQLVAR